MRPVTVGIFFKIVSVSLFPLLDLGVCYSAQRCGQTPEWLTDRGTSTCASRKSPPPVNTLAWLDGRDIVYWAVVSL